jgi:hypothetical protein
LEPPASGSSSTKVAISRIRACCSGPYASALRKAPISISLTVPPEGRLASCLMKARPEARLAGEQPAIAVGTAIELSGWKGRQRHLLAFCPGDTRRAGAGREAPVTEDVSDASGAEALLAETRAELAA